MSWETEELAERAAISDAYRDADAFSPEEQEGPLWQRLVIAIESEIARRVDSLIADNATGERDRGAIDALRTVTAMPQLRYERAAAVINEHEGHE